MYNEPADTLECNGWKIEIWYDELSGQECPADVYDLAGKILQNSKRHITFGEYVSDIKEAIEENEWLYIPICISDYGSNGKCIYTYDDEEYDEASHHGIICVESSKIETDWQGNKDNALKCLKAEIQIMNYWLEGSVYGYKLVHPITGEEGDSCWCFYGYDNVKEEAERVANECAPHTLVSDLERMAKESDDIQSQLDELVSEVKASEAAEINNSGVQEQIKFLIDSGCKSNIEEVVSGT